MCEIWCEVLIFNQRQLPRLKGFHAFFNCDLNVHAGSIFIGAIASNVSPNVMKTRTLHFG